MFFEILNDAWIKVILDIVLNGLEKQITLKISRPSISTFFFRRGRFSQVLLQAMCGMSQVQETVSKRLPMTQSAFAIFSSPNISVAIK